MVIDLESKEDMKQVLECVSECEVLSPKVQGRMDPRVIMYNVERSLPEEDLFKELIKMNLQNLGDFDELRQEMKVIFKTKSRVKSFGSKGVPQLSDKRVNVVISV